MGFVVFEKGSSPLPSVPSVTIQKKGLISLNRAAMDMLKGLSGVDPEGIELLWDSENRVVGLRAAPLSAPNSYPVRPQGAKNRGPFLVAGTLFTKFIGLDTTEARRWAPTLQDGVLCIDLDGPSAKVVGRGRVKRDSDPALQSEVMYPQ